MEDLIVIKVVQKLPMIVLQRELEEFDLAPVTEKENSIRFIFDDDPWEKDGDNFTIKLRFRRAGDLDRELRRLQHEEGLKMSQEHFMTLARICRVQKSQTESEDSKESVEQTLYMNSIEKIKQAIDDFNMATMVMGVTK